MYQLVRTSPTLWIIQVLQKFLSSEDKSHFVIIQVLQNFLSSEDKSHFVIIQVLQNFLSSEDKSYFVNYLGATELPV